VRSCFAHVSHLRNGHEAREQKGTNPGPPDRTRRTRRTTIVLKTPPHVLNDTAVPVIPRSGRRGRRFKSCHPDHVCAGQRPAAGCDQTQEVGNVSELLANFRESADIVVHSCELRSNRPERARRTHSRACHARIEVDGDPGFHPMSWSFVAPPRRSTTERWCSSSLTEHTGRRRNHAAFLALDSIRRRRPKQAPEEVDDAHLTSDRARKRNAAFKLCMAHRTRTNAHR
jgi:hypothetical protein